VAGHAVEGIVQTEAAVHFRDGTAENIDVSPGVVASQGAIAEGQARLDEVEGMPGPAGAAEEHLGDVDGIDALDLPGRQTVAEAGGMVYQVEASPELLEWSPVDGVEMRVKIIDATWEEVTVSTGTVGAGANGLFARIRVSQGG
jgi:hypothetical protein